MDRISSMFPLGHWGWWDIGVRASVPVMSGTSVGHWGQSECPSYERDIGVSASVPVMIKIVWNAWLRLIRSASYHLVRSKIIL